MKREIKFRAWDNVREQMYWFDVMWGENNSSGTGWVAMAPFGEPMSKHKHRDNLVPVDPMDCEIMQFTGLYDKNGKEIYEGDITNYGTVCYSDYLTWDGGGSRHSGFYFKDEIDTGGELSYNLGFDDEIEIIGNIYENPELIN